MKSIRSRKPFLFVLIGFCSALALMSGCASKKTKTEIELGELLGKKVALVEIDGEATSKKSFETALINQIVETGSFELVSKQDVEAAKVDPAINSADPVAVAKKAGADFALLVGIKEFSAVEAEGYSAEEVYDSQLAEERGEAEGKTNRLYKVKSLTGTVTLDLKMIDTSTKETRASTVTEREKAQAEAKSSAIRLPPKLRFLETLTQKALKKFFQSAK